MFQRVAWITVVLVTLGGCLLEPLALDERECPCAVGFTCNPIQNRCIRGIQLDAGTDSSQRDSTPADVQAGTDGTTPTDSTSMIDATLDSGDDSTNEDSGLEDVIADVPVLPGSVCDDIGDTLFCSGFESTPGPTQIVNGTVRHVTDTVFRGNAALEATATASTDESSYARGVIPDFPPVPSGELYFQARVFFSALPDEGSIGIGTLWGPSGSASLGFFPGGGLSVYLSGPDTSIVATDFRMPLGRWVCIRFRTAVADAGAIELFVEDTSVALQNGVDTLYGVGFNGGSFGMTFTSPGLPSTTVLMDEVVLSTTPITCAGM